MPRKKHNELIAGVFVLVTVAAALGIIFWLGAADYFSTKGQLAVFYTMQKDGSTNLQNGAYVMTGDLRIGQIVSIGEDFNTGRCLYTVRLGRKDILIHADGQAQVSSNMLGQAKLVVTTFGQSKELADQDHPVKIATSGMDAVMGQLSAAGDKVNALLAQLQAEHIIEDFKKASTNIVAFTSNLDKQTNVQEQDSTIAKLNKSLTDINEITADAKPKVASALSSIDDMSQRLDQYSKKDVADILAQLREASTQIPKIIKNIDDISQQARDLVVMNRDNLDVMVNNLTLVSSNLKAMSNEVRRNPWRLLYKPSDKETRQQDIYDAAAAFSQGASQLDMAAAKLSGLIKANPQGVAANDPTIQQVMKDIKETFAKFSKAEQALWNELQK